MSLRARLTVVTLSVLIFAYTVVGGWLYQEKGVLAKSDPYVQLKIFGDVLRHIVRDYVDEPDLEKVRIGALRGLADGLDPYSAYLTPEQAKKYQPAKNDGQSTGLILSRVAGYVYVLSTVKGSPADQVGLRSGDFIEYIDKLATRDISLYEAEEVLNTAAETELKIFRRGRPYKVKVKRGPVTTPETESRLLEAGIGYLHLTSFADDHIADIQAKLQQFQQQGVQKLVLDLRGAANGSLETGAEVANLFIGSGTLAKQIGRSGNVEKTLDARSSKVAFTGQLTLVVDRSTAMAGEVVVAAVIANKRGEVVGERTFGAGSTQRLFDLKGGAAMLITTSKYASPAGKPFMDLKETPGIAPTIEVKAAVVNEDTLPEDNEQADNQTEVDAVLPIEPKVNLTDDVQVKKAIDVLKGIAEKKANIDVNSNTDNTQTLFFSNNLRPAKRM
jgi:carboxyl-terminal processing protease